MLEKILRTFRHHLFSFLAISSSSCGDEQKFMVIALPDTQYYSQDYPELFTAQTQWILDLKERLNIAFVTHLGDVVNLGSTDPSQWENALGSLHVLDGMIPYGLAIGNHDYDDQAVSTRQHTFWDRYFGNRKYQGEEWWGGHYAQSPVNNYQFFTAGNLEFMIMHLEFCPSDDVLAWANQNIAAYPQKQVILSTHLYLDQDDGLVDKNSYAHCQIYAAAQEGNDGQQIWEKLVKNHRNIFLVLSGHIPGTGYLASRGIHGNTVHQLLADYQHVAQGGNGFLLKLQFRPATDKIVVRAYSPILQEYDPDFKLELEHEF